MAACAGSVRLSVLRLILFWTLLAAPLAAQETSILVVDLDRAYEIFHLWQIDARAVPQRQPRRGCGKYAHS